VKSRAAVFLLAAMVIFLPLSHVEIDVSDDSWLLRVDGRPVDVAGYFSEKYSALTRTCSKVQDLQPSDPLFADALDVIRRYSQPDSLSAQLVALSMQGDWLLARVRFNRLQDAVVLLVRSEQDLMIVSGGVWSGSTHPHRPEPMIRRYLRNRVPAAPLDLTDCLEPMS